MKSGAQRRGPKRRLLRTSPERSALFARVRQRGTAPEVVVQGLLAMLGCDFVTNVRGIPGSPDIVDEDHVRAVFVHGCYWHRHLGCQASSTPRHNARFWRDKFLANVRRDRRNARQLRKLGYRVMVVWECQTKSEAGQLRLKRRLERFFREQR